jgi:hypothetical protein
MGLIDFFSSLGKPRAQAPMGVEAAAEPGTFGNSGGGFSGMFRGLSSFNERHPGFLMGAGQLLKGEDMNPAILYAMGVKKERKAEAEKTANQNKTAAYLRSKGYSDEEIDAATANPAIMSQLLRGKERNLINVGGGRLYDEDTGEIIDTGAGEDEYTDRARRAAEFGLEEGTPEFQEFVLTGDISARRGGKGGMNPTEMKALYSAEDEIPALDNTIATLEQAKALNDKTYTGKGAGWAGTIGATVPGGDWVFDKQKAENTLEFSKLMSMEAIQAMAAALTGATTNFELNKFVEILADPATPPDVRARTIDRMMQLAQRQRDLKARRVQELRGDDGGGGGAADPLGIR